jgi:TM2 domain-containing membrane protein YozV
MLSGSSFCHPMPKDPVARRGGSAFVPGSHKFAATQNVNGGLHGAFGKTGGFGDVLKASFDWTPLAARG